MPPFPNRSRSKALNESEQLFFSFMEHLPGLAWIKDVDGAYVYANDAAANAFQTTQAELYGKTDEQIFPPETAALFKKGDHQALDGNGGVKLVETLEHEDGIVHYSLVSKFPIPRSDGNVGFIGGMAIDITDRVHAEQAMVAAQDQLRIITDAMSACVTRCTRDLKYSWASKPYAEWVGLPLESIVGRPIIEILGEKAFNHLLPYFKRVLSGEVVNYEMEVDLAERGHKWINAVYTPTYDSDGNVDGWVAVIADIDIRRRAENALRDADLRKDEFLATLAHELRNPLAPIRHSVYLLRNSTPSESDLEKLYETVERQTNHLTRLVDDLLELSRISRGEIALQKAPIELAEALAAAIETSRPIIDAAGHKLKVDLPKELAIVNGDLIRLSQVFANLLNNAAKYADAPGSITISGSRSNGFVEVNITDEGIGISKEMLSRIFEMFAQVDRSRRHSQGGLGIGLSLVKKIVEMHDGSVTAHSEGIGKGSTFKVRFGDLGVETTTTSKSINFEQSKNALNLLTVDDNRDSADSLGMMLSLTGAEVRVAYDGPSALVAIKQQKPSAVFLDIGMPGMDGYEVAREVRKDPTLADVVLIALTGWGQDSDRQNSKDAGFNHHLIKPVDLEVLQEL